MCGKMEAHQSLYIAFHVFRQRFDSYLQTVDYDRKKKNRYTAAQCREELQHLHGRH